MKKTKRKFYGKERFKTLKLIKEYIRMNPWKSAAIGCALLMLLFITLKVTHVIDWSWWFVLMPGYIPVVGLLLWIIFCIVVIATSDESEWIEMDGEDCPY